MEGRMSLSFRIRRRAGIPPQTGPLSGSAELDATYLDWLAAGDALRSAQQASGPPDTILTLAAAAKRARNALTRAQIANGWVAPDEVLADLQRDELLVQEDASHR
jgi:hypothetical protein